MSLPDVVSRVDWLAARKELLVREKQATRARSVAPVEYNYRARAEHEQAGSAYYLDGEQPIELPGLSCFLRDDDQVFHTYSAYGRGLDMIGFGVNVLDRIALGRQEDWEEPKGRSDGIGRKAGSPQIRYHDEYGH